MLIAFLGLSCLQSLNDLHILFFGCASNFGEMILSVYQGFIDRTKGSVAAGHGAAGVDADPSFVASVHNVARLRPWTTLDPSCAFMVALREDPDLLVAHCALEQVQRAEQ